MLRARGLCGPLNVYRGGITPRSRTFRALPSHGVEIAPKTAQLCAFQAEKGGKAIFTPSHNGANMVKYTFILASKGESPQ